MKKVFGKLNMSWLKAVLFAAAAGLYTGIVMSIPALEDTSFRDIGVTYEWWVVFAVIIVVNCRKCWEAMLKCFVFFLISQPLVYLVEVVFGALAMERAIYYYRSIWLPITFLVLPGGLIAFFCKKQNILGGAILGIGNAIQAVLGIFYFSMALKSFPRHLLTSLFCFASIFVMTFSIQEKGRNRLAALLLCALLTAGVFFAARAMGRSFI